MAATRISGTITSFTVRRLKRKMRLMMRRSPISRSTSGPLFCTSRCRSSRVMKGSRLVCLAPVSQSTARLKVAKTRVKGYMTQETTHSRGARRWARRSGLPGGTQPVD